MALGAVWDWGEAKYRNASTYWFGQVLKVIAYYPDQGHAYETWNYVEQRAPVRLKTQQTYDLSYTVWLHKPGASRPGPATIDCNPIDEEGFGY